MSRLWSVAVGFFLFNLTVSPLSGFGAPTVRFSVWWTVCRRCRQHSDQMITVLSFKRHRFWSSLICARSQAPKRLLKGGWAWANDPEPSSNGFGLLVEDQPVFRDDWGVAKVLLRSARRKSGTHPGSRYGQNANVPCDAATNLQWGAFPCFSDQRSPASSN